MHDGARGSGFGERPNRKNLSVVPITTGTWNACARVLSRLEAADVEDGGAGQEKATVKHSSS